MTQPLTETAWISAGRPQGLYGYDVTVYGGPPWGALYQAPRVFAESAIEAAKFFLSQANYASVEARPAVDKRIPLRTDTALLIG